MSTRSDKQPLSQSLWSLQSAPITKRLVLVKPLTERSLQVCHGLVLFNCFTALLSTAFAIFSHELFSKIIIGVFVVWKKRVLVKRRAVDQSVCLLTIALAEPAELTIQVNAARISFLYF